MSDCGFASVKTVIGRRATSIDAPRKTLALVRRRKPLCPRSIRFIFYAGADRESDLFARPNATVHYSARPWGRWGSPPAPMLPALWAVGAPPVRVPERVSPLAAPHSPSYRLALVKPEWSVGQNV